MTHSTVAGSNQQPITLDPRFADEWSVLSPLNGDSDFVPLKLLDPATTDLLSPSHPILEAIADSITGRHQSTIRYELRLCFGRYLRDGFFKYNAGLFGFIHNTKVRDKFKEVIEGVSKITKGYVRGVTSFRRVFILPGILRKGASYIGSRKSALTCDPCLLLWLPIPCSWLTSKYEAWSNYCYVKNLSQNLDCDGRTDWGTALRTAHLKMTVPKNLPEGLSPEAVARHKALTETGVPNIAYLTHGRANHPTSNLAKPIRRLARTSGAQTLELDLHASHTCLLLAKIAASNSKTNSVIEVQGGSWYGQFTESYGMYLLWAESQGIAYRDADGNWFTWSAKHNRFEPASIKVEYQRQCLFWSDHRPEANLMRQTLRSRHYALYNAIMEHRETLNASKFATLLTRREGALFVKDLVPTLHARGITVVSNNDGVIVPKHHAAAAVEAMEVIAFQHLGFVPHISIK